MIRITHLLTGILVTVCLSSQSILAQDRAPIADAAEATQPLTSGETIPEVSVKGVNGEPIPLKSLHQDKPVVLVFFRGGWCPICTRHTQGLIKIYPQIKEMGAELVGISPDSPESSRQNAAKHTIPFPVLSDADVSASTAFGLGSLSTLQRSLAPGGTLSAAPTRVFRSPVIVGQRSIYSVPQAYQRPVQTFRPPIIQYRRF
jgi:peroxiredoxin